MYKRQEVYRVIIEEFCRICELYYNSTGDTKKDAGLRLMRQIKLLIKACSVPHLIEGYFGNGYPNKTVFIEKLIRKIPGKVAVGCTSIAAFELYENLIRERFPDYPILATGGADDESIRATIRAGANAIIWTPPTSGELFRDVMKNYREGKPHP